MSAIIRKIIQNVAKKIKKIKRGKGWSDKSKNIGVNQARKEKLFTTVGKDKHGDINIINTGPQTGKRMPLDVPEYTKRRPWVGPHSGHQGPKIPHKAHGGLIRGFPKIAKKGWK